MASSELQIIVNGVDQFSKKIGKSVDGIAGKFSGLGSKVGKIGGGIATAIGGVATTGLKTFGIAAGAVGVGIAGIGLALGKMSTDAASVEGVKNAFDNLSEQAGTTGEDMLAAMQKGSGGTIAARDLMTQYNKASSLVSEQFAGELPGAMDLVSKAAAATGQDMGFLMDSLVTGVGRVSPMILDNLGVQIDLTEATEAYAEANGLVASEMTKTEQQMAVQEMVMGKLEDKYGDMDSVFETNASKMQQLQATFTDFKDDLGAAFMPVLTQLMDILSELATAIMPAIIPFVEAFAAGFQTVFTVLEPLIPIITDFATSMAGVATMFASGDIGGAVELFGDAMGGLVESLVDVLPGMLEFGADLIMSIVEGIAAALPALMTGGVEIILSLIDTLVPMIPEMLQIGIDILLALINGIASALPGLIPMAVEIILGLVTTVIENIPMIIDTGINLLLSLLEGILSALPILVTQIPEIIITLIETLVEKLPDILTMGVEILIALIDGIIGAIPELAAAIPEIITALIDAIITLLPLIIVAGIDMLGALIEGLLQAIPVLIAALPMIWDALVSWFKEKDWGQIGADIVGGISTGLIGAWEIIKTAFGDLLAGLPLWAKKILGIASPSKVFMEIGAEIPAGLAIGIEDNMKLPELMMENLSNIRLPNTPGAAGQQFAGAGNVYNYNLTMPTSNRPEEIGMAFELLQAYGG